MKIENKHYLETRTFEALHGSICALRRLSVGDDFVYVEDGPQFAWLNLVKGTDADGCVYDLWNVYFWLDADGAGQVSFWIETQSGIAAPEGCTEDVEVTWSGDLDGDLATLQSVLDKWVPALRKRLKASLAGTAEDYCDNLGSPNGYTITYN